MERSWPTPPSDANQSLYLWALEIVKLLRTGEVLTVGAIPTVRTVLTANRTSYVRTDGNDANDGLANTAGGAFKTLQAAWNATTMLDLNGFAVTIQIADGTYTAGVNMISPVLGGNVTFQGNSGTPANVLISTTSANCFTLACVGNVTIKDMKVQTTTSGDCLNASVPPAKLFYQNMNFGACAGVHVNASSGSIECPGSNYTISGGASSHFAAALGGILNIYNNTITLTGTPAFSTAFIFMFTSGIASFFSVTFSGAATGKRFEVDDNAIIETFGGSLTYFPGSTAGTVAAGGVYVGLVDYATDAQVRAASAGRFVMTVDKIASASVQVTLTDAATVAVDWASGINFDLTITANRILGNPTNAQPGTFRTVRVAGNNATLRTLTFDTNYFGNLPVITDATGSPTFKQYLITIFCVSSTHFVPTAVRAL